MKHVQISISPPHSKKPLIYLAVFYFKFRVCNYPYLADQIKSRDLLHNQHIGRLYRIKYKGTDTKKNQSVKENTQLKKITYLHKLSAAQLIPFLSHSNGWHRDTAKQLIVMKQDKSVINALKTMAISHTDHLA